MSIPLSSFADSRTQEPIPVDVMTRIAYWQRPPNIHSMRLRVCDMNLNPIQVMPDKAPKWWTKHQKWLGPWDSSDISPFSIVADISGLGLQSATFSHDTDRPVHRQLQFSMLDPASRPDSIGTDEFPFNPFQHCLHLSAQVINLIEDVVVEIPLGFFLAYWSQEWIGPTATFNTWTVLDMSSLIAVSEFASDYVIFKDYTSNMLVGGTYLNGYLGAFADMVTVDSTDIEHGGEGITPAGLPDVGPAWPVGLIPIGTPLFPDDGNLPVDHDTLWQAGQNRLDAATTTLDALKYNPPWCDGYCRLRSRQAWDFGSPDSPNIPAIEADLSALPGTSLIEGPISRNFQNLTSDQATNYVVVEGSPATATAGQAVVYRSVAINTGLDSDGNINSILGTTQLRGLGGKPRALLSYQRTDNLASQAVADLAASVALQEGSMVTDALQFTMLPFPFLEDRDVVTCFVPSASGKTLVSSDATGPFIVKNWTMPMDPSTGRTTIEMQRIEPV